MAELGMELAKVPIELVMKRVLDEVEMFVWGSKIHRERLKENLEYVQALLQDLPTNNSKDSSQPQMVNLWLKKVKNVANSAENLVDDYAYESLRMKHKFTTTTNSSSSSNNNNKCLPSVLLCFYKIKFHFQMYSKVKEILLQFDEIHKEAQRYGFKPAELAKNGNSQNNNNNEGIMSTAAWNQAREHATYNSGFVGRENDMKDLLDMLLHPQDINTDDGLATVAIVGMGGLGKTTLARRLYDHEEIDTQFGNNNKRWISAKNFNIPRILNEMAESANSNRALSNTDVIIRILKDKIKESKMLVVLDDVWEDNGELWDSLKGQLRGIGALPGSVILVTTRNRNVAAKAGVTSPHMLKPLSSDDSWKMTNNSLIRSNVSCHMEEVGRRIIEKCGGVPLAIKVMGSLLRSIPYSLSDWERIETSNIWDLQLGKDEILPSLLLSFNHLPYPPLKQCFAYYAVIPKGYLVGKTELVGLWLSQGYLRADKRKSVEDIGEEYINILVSHSLLEEEYEPGMRKFVLCKAHDLVHDLAAYVSRDEFTKEAKDLRENVGFRHLAFRFDKDTSTSDFPADEHVVTMLRTIDLGDSVSVQWHWLKDARYLRTLFLYSTGITELPSEIERLKHLRYLDVSDNPISTLPDSIGKLYQLETLILQECENMSKLPKVLNTLVSLRHILTTAPMYACKGLQQLRNLQTLPHLCLDDDGDGWSIGELGELVELRDDIRIKGLQCVKDKEQARKAGLAGKSKVTKLALSWDKERQGSVCNDEDVLDGLEPHPNITSLEVENFNGERFPTWVTRMAVVTREQRGTRTKLLSNLTVVELVGCFRCQTLPTLGQLTQMESLVLEGFDVECIGKEFYGGEDTDMRTATATFRNLKKLKVSKFGRLITWTVLPQGAFPCLEILEVRSCPLLESVPAGLGSKALLKLVLDDLDSMRSLDIIKYSTGLTSLEMARMAEIRSLPEGLANCTKLMSLEIRDCEKLVSLPSGGFTSLVSLQSLRIMKCPMMEAATTDVSKLVRLSKLEIRCNSAQHLRSLLQALEHLPRLKSLWIADVVPFEKEDEMGEYLSEVTPYNNQPSITYLGLSGRPKIKSLPRQIGLLTRITMLNIWDFEDLEEIPDWICDLSSLETLDLYKCGKLKRLPSKEALQRLPGLNRLWINECPVLAERYAKDHGPEWHTISHISSITIHF